MQRQVKFQPNRSIEDVMSSSKKKNKKLARLGNQKKARPRTRAVALIKDAVKRLPLDLPSSATPDSTEIPAQVKTPGKGPVKTNPPVTLTGKKVTGEERTPNTDGTEGGVFDFGFGSQMQLFATMLQSPLTLLLHQQALLTQMLLNWRYPKETRQHK